ncbi:hypothetical protein DITRI_Ditri05aG0082900 [Diplodiscus trichospermus]
MDYQGAEQRIENTEKESVSNETSDLAPTKPNKFFLKLKFCKTSKRSDEHICPVCSKGFASGKALGGHIRIHMKGSKYGRHRKISKLQPRNVYRAKAKKRIAKNKVLPKATDDAVDLPLIDQEGNEKVSCCICKKDFRSKKSLFGHMRNHPERSWRGIRPPPSEKNSCCSSVSENDEALVVDQITCETEKGLVSGSDLLNSLPKWTNTAKRCGKFTCDENEIPEAAYCLMKLSRGDPSDLGQLSVECERKHLSKDKLTTDKTPSWGLANKASEEKKGVNVLGKEIMSERKGKATVKTECYEERVRLEGKRGDTMMCNFLPKEFNCEMMEMENKTEEKVIEKKISCFDKFQKEGHASTMEGAIFPSQKPDSYPKNPKGELSEAPLIETASPAEVEHLYSKTLFPTTASQEDEGSQFCTARILDFDLNEPYVDLDDEAAAAGIWTIN